MSYKFGRIPKQKRKTIGKITPILLHLRQLLLERNNLSLRKKERKKEKEREGSNSELATARKFSKVQNPIKNYNPFNFFDVCKALKKWKKVK